MISKHWLLVAAASTTQAAALWPLKVAAATSQPTCGCTATVTEYQAAGLQVRQETCPPPMTVTVTTAAPTVTIVAEDPSSVASSFSYAAGVDSIVHQNSYEDRPTGEPPETTPIFYTHTAFGPAVIGTDDPNDGLTVYEFQSTGTAPVATTVVSFAPADPVKGIPAPSSTRTEYDPRDPDRDGIVTVTTYRSTETVYPFAATTSAPSNLSITGRGMQKRQTCSMIYAKMNGHWASWCNEWDGSTTVKYSTYNTTSLITNVPGAPAVPSSVYDPSGTLEQSYTIQTTPAEPTSTSTPPSPSESTTSNSVSPTSTSIPTELPGPPTTSWSTLSPGATFNPSSASGVVTSVVVTASVVVTFPVATVTETNTDSESTSTSSVPMATAVCGQQGPFTITFEDLPTYSTHNPNDTSLPPIFSPYEHFYWTNGYSYGPPPYIPYDASLQDRLAEYSPKSEPAGAWNASQGRDIAGSFGAGVNFFNTAFWFDAKSAMVGCNNTVIGGVCNIYATGYRWIANQDPNASRAEGEERLAFSQSYDIPYCAAQPCNLTQITFDAAKYSGLSTINFMADVNGIKSGFFLDDFAADWTNSSCEAGLERQSSK